MTAERRKLQLQSLLLRAVQERLARGLSDPRVRGLVTATRLELSGDLKRAKVYITVLPAEHAKLTMHGIQAATGRLRRDVMEKIHIREMPSLVFVYDEGMRNQQEVMSLLAKDRQNKQPEADEPEQEQEPGPDAEGTP
ncbi:MAG: 30S ribosome-binding factor RbfA [Phycisphaerales bacterium]|nr:30S ribosome-binding factor RbfA [Planctomycetota bacterium]MCH8508590.1 30S ribosome-binding factor RbfA [Phycisphaerales bacterium]